MDTPSVLHWRSVILPLSLALILACVIIALRIQTNQYISNIVLCCTWAMMMMMMSNTIVLCVCVRVWMCVSQAHFCHSPFNKCVNCISSMIFLSLSLFPQTYNKLYCNYSILFVCFDNSKCYCISFIVWRCWFMTRTQITWFVFHHHHYFRSVSFVVYMLRCTAGCCDAVCFAHIQYKFIFWYAIEPPNEWN